MSQNLNLITQEHSLMSNPVTIARGSDIDAFIGSLGSPRPRPPSGGRLILALDATGSRERTWDRACQIQGGMFEATAALGGLEIQLVYYRGFDECRASRWVTSASALHRLMRDVSCAAGSTQIGRVLNHAIAQARNSSIGGLIFVGDALEEPADAIVQKAATLGRLGTRCFMLFEGDEDFPPSRAATNTFERIAMVSGGAYLPFSFDSIARLKVLLGAIASYVTGGRQALEAYGRRTGSPAVLQLTAQLRFPREEVAS